METYWYFPSRFFLHCFSKRKWLSQLAQLGARWKYATDCSPCERCRGASRLRCSKTRKVQACIQGGNKIRRIKRKTRGRVNKKITYLFSSLVKICRNSSFLGLNEWLILFSIHLIRSSIEFKESLKNDFGKWNCLLNYENINEYSGRKKTLKSYRIKN